jgi:hypothetical protein
VGHTHPYDASEGGYQDVAFSDQDLSRLVTAPERTHIVRSGASIFEVRKTDTFDALVKGKNDAALTKLQADMKKTWNDARRAASGTFQERVLAAVKAVCNTYGLLLFKGTGSSVTQVDVTR